MISNRTDHPQFPPIGRWDIRRKVSGASVELLVRGRFKHI